MNREATFTISNRDKLECVVREIGVRRRVYARMVEKGKMSQQKATREIELMEAIARDYLALAKSDELVLGA